jgi:surface antigen
MKQSLSAGLAFAALLLAACSSVGMSGGPPPAVAITSPPPAAPAVPTGAALGGVLGGPVGASLSEADRQRAWEAQVGALDSGQRRSWRGAGGVFGFVEPGPVTGGGCRTFSQTVYVSGRPNRGHGVACKQSDGAWKMSS